MAIWVKVKKKSYIIEIIQWVDKNIRFIGPKNCSAGHVV